MEAAAFFLAGLTAAALAFPFPFLDESDVQLAAGRGWGAECCPYHTTKLQIYSHFLTAARTTDGMQRGPKCVRSLWALLLLLLLYAPI